MVALLFAAVPLWGQRPNTPAAPAPALVPAEPAWEVMLEQAPSSAGAVDEARIYLPLQMDRFDAFALTSGQRLWSLPLASTGAPVVDAGVLFVVTVDSVRALDAASGNERWRHAVPVLTGLSAALTPDSVLVGGNPSMLIALSRADGRERWRRELPSPPAHPPATDARAAYLTLEGGAVAAVSLGDGSLLWERRLDAGLAPPITADNRVIVGTDANEVFALDVTDGRIAWRWRVGGDVVGAGANADTIFFAGLDNLLRAVRNNGNQRWKTPLASRPAFPPQVLGPFVVVTSASPTVSVYDALTGTATGSYTAPAELAGPVMLPPPSASQDVSMVVATRDGRLIGLRPMPAPPPEPAPDAGQGEPSTAPIRPAPAPLP